MIDKGRCDKGFIWNPGNCECECDKSCDIRQNLNYKNCQWRKELIPKLVEKWCKNIDRNEMIRNDYRNVCNSCTIFIELFVIAFLIFIGIISAYFYFHWHWRRVILVLLILI